MHAHKATSSKHSIDEKKMQKLVKYNSFNVNTVSAASQISRRGPHVLIISSSQGESSPAAFVGLIHLENTTIVESDRMCLWAWVRKGWVHPTPPHSWLSYPGKIQFSLHEAAPWRGPESRGMELTNNNPSRGSQLG